jgi:hypothetical protein
VLREVRNSGHGQGRLLAGREYRVHLVIVEVSVWDADIQKICIWNEVILTVRGR